MKIDTISRFSSKAERYAKYRPDYAPQAIDAIVAHAKLTKKSVVADIGSGTGIVSRHFVERGNRVYAVEPNPKMRRLAENKFGGFSNFISVDGDSEQTTLPPESIDLITAGQSIHWFYPEPTKREFCRIRRPNASFAVLHYSRPPDDPMIAALRRLYVNPKYGWKKSIRPEGRPIRWWFPDENQPIALRFESPHTFDREAFIGVSTSNSDAPDEGLPAFNAFVEALKGVFDTFQVGGKVTINYTTHLILGQIG